MRSVNDDYILQDGEVAVVEMPFMDANGRPMIHDGQGNPAGQRPGFLYSDANEQAEQSLVDAYAEYDATIRERWRQSEQSSKQTQSPPQTFDSTEAASAEYEARICGAWRK
jgi:hypothetical protein